MRLRATDAELRATAAQLHAEGRLTIASLRQALRGGSSSRLQAAIREVRETTAQLPQFALAPAKHQQSSAGIDDSTTAAAASALVLTPKQCRAARAVLDIGTIALATASKLSRSTIERFERGELQSKPDTVRLLQAYFEFHGIRLTENGLQWSERPNRPRKKRN